MLMGKRIVLQILIKAIIETDLKKGFEQKMFVLVKTHFLKSVKYYS